MNTKRILELAKKLDEAWQALQHELGGSLPSGAATKSKYRTRQDHSKFKGQLLALFQGNAQRGYSFDDLKAELNGVPFPTLRGQLRYLQAAKVVEKVGDAYRLKSVRKLKGMSKGTLKPKAKLKAKTNGHSPRRAGGRKKPDIAKLQAQTLQIVNKKPPTKDELRRTLGCSWEYMMQTVKSLTKDGLIKVVPVEGKSVDGKTIMSKRVVPVSYQAQA